MKKFNKPIKSIRAKLFIGVTCLVVFFVAFTIILNSFFLKPFYIFQKEKMLITASENIDSIYKGIVSDNYLEFEKMERNNGIKIVILDISNNLVYDSYRNFSEIGAEKGKGKDSNDELSSLELFANASLNDDGIAFKIAKDQRLNTSFLYLYHKLHTGETLMLSIPIQEITENTYISNTFLMFTGIITIILGIFVMFIYSKKFTQPILKLNKLAQNMSQLNFKEKYIVTSEDEIGELGNSINSLSMQLDASINELKQKNAQLELDIEKERKIDEMRKEFIANVSHELKTPISLIQGYAEGLKLNVAQDEEDKNFYCTVIIDEAAKMNQLVKKLLNLSLIDSGNVRLDKSKFDISELLQNVVNKFKTAFNQNGITAKIKNVDHDGQETNQQEEIFVFADMLMIEQVLTNYINNAINHVDQKKVIKLRIYNDNENSKNMVRIFVYNSGKPIPEGDALKVWESFYKVDKARTRAYGGAGLGLSIVAGIQKLHKSDYGLENVKDGVEFWFDIKRAKDDED